MSQDFGDPELFADFVVEAKEHLETIEPNLLELEKSPENLDLLNEIFRPMHSLKGASGFLGLNKINVLAHRAENVLDELRKGSMTVTSEIMDVILTASDQLRTMIENLEAEGNEGDVDTESTIATLDGVLAGEMPEPREAAREPEPAGGEAEETLEQAEAEPGPEPEEGDTYSLTIVAKEHLDDFLEEAGEIVSNLNDSLLELEKDPAQGGDLVNDIFRYFHNLKGNSGIIAYRELNELCHEAETLLGRIRKNEIEATRNHIDLLLAVVDDIEHLLGAIDKESATVSPHGIDVVLDKLQRATAGEEIDPPAREGGEPEQEAAVTEEATPEPVEPEPASAESAAPGVDPEDLTVFELTVNQQLDAVDYALSELSKDPDQKDYIDGLYRSLVTIQNSSGYMGLSELKTTAERTAGLVDQARNSDMSFELMIDILKQECGIINDMVSGELDRLKAGAEGAEPEETASETTEEAPPPELEAKPEPGAGVEPEAETGVEPEAETETAPDRAPEPETVSKEPNKAEAAKAKAQRGAQAAGAKAQKPKTSSTIRVDHEKLDHLMNLIGELIINRNRFSMITKSIEEQDDLDQDEIAVNLTESTYAMARISDDLQDTIMKVRMVQVSSVFSRFPRLVRDLSRKSGKQVELVMEGEDTELDKSVIEVIGDPLVHLIRNSVDHGLENAEERRAAGKDPTGKVWLRAYHKGNSVVIEVEDDGRGIDPEKMREVGVKKGVISAEEAKNLDDREAVDLIFAPGFSGAAKVTDISGRGVGMDVVRTNIKNLKGSIGVRTEVGKGSTFTLSLPLTLAIIDALMVTVSGQTYAIPLDSVSETTKIEAERLTEVNKRKAITLRGEVMGVIELSEILDLDKNLAQREVLPVVIIQDNQRRLGLVVDSLLERQEIVIKSLGDYLGEKEGISGATIMGDGSVVLILDPHEIQKMATARAV
jgi:two-component system chemotaxis sensor kinase CheA